MVEIPEDFESRCKLRGGEAEIWGPSTIVCRIKDPYISDLNNIFASTLKLAKEGKIPRLTTIYTERGKFAIYEEPEFKNELVRVDFTPFRIREIVYTKRFDDLLTGEI